MQKLNIFLSTILIANVVNAKNVLIIESQGIPCNITMPGKNIAKHKINCSKHANIIYNIIANNVPKSTKIDYCGFSDTKEYYHCLKLVKNYDIVNMSLSGPYPLDKKEYILLNSISKSTTIVIAAGNDGQNRLGFPAAYAKSILNIKPISALDDRGKRLPTSNYNSFSIDFYGITVYNKEIVTGTSIAAAHYTNMLIKSSKP